MLDRGKNTDGFTKRMQKMHNIQRERDGDLTERRQLCHSVGLRQEFLQVCIK